VICMASLFILCHTIFHDVWRNYERPSEHQSSARFFVRYLIEKRTSMTDDDVIAVTSEEVINSMSGFLPNQGSGQYQAQLVLALKNIVFPLPTKIQNLNESVVIIADVLASRGTDVILVSNMPNKVNKIVDFYQKYEKTSKKWQPKHIDEIFKIMNTTELEAHLRKTDKETCNNVDLQFESV